jgi:hypothetical protein
MLKKILTVIGGIVVLLLVAPAVLSSKLHLDRSIEIQRSPASVHGFLADLNRYPKWNPFSENDPSSTAQITGAGVGSTLAWKGDKTGEGKMTITELQAGQSVQLKLEFFKPMAGEARIEWRTESLDANRTRMTWSMDEDLPYLQRYFGLLMKGPMGMTFEKGLGNLKREAEKS